MSKEKILGEAKERFRRCQSYYSNQRANWKADLSFAYGDHNSLGQWETDTVDSRSSQGKPTFTINRTKNYNLSLVNDAKQNKSEIQVRAVGGGASFQAAEVIEGIVRHINYISSAEACFEQACHDQVFAGMGFWRVTTDYANDSSFDQEIFIRPLKTLSVYIDPHHEQADGSDMTFAFVFTDMDIDDYKKTYPRYKDAVTDLPFDTRIEDDLWLSESRVRICEYFRKTFKPDTLHALQDGSMVKESELKEAGMLDAIQDISVNQRDIQIPVVEWYLIAGDKIISESTFPSKYIPIVKCPGLEVTIDGIYDAVSHTRSLHDPQVAYNWFSSSGVEFVAAQSRSPWLADVASIEGYEEYWRDANVKNYSVLPYKGHGDDGAEIEPPRRADPPVYAGAFLDGMKVSASEMEMVSGQPPAAMGESSQERSGKAVLERQRAAANGTYHFVNALSNAIKFTGKILIDMICNGKVYDTPRVMKILSQSGEMQTIALDPNHPQPHTQMPNLDQESIDPQQVAHIINPTIGDYDVVAETGPQYTTRREQFVSATMDILAQNESLTPLIGDLVFANMDFPGAQEIAHRMRRMVPPQALGQVDPQVQQLQQQLEQAQMVMKKMAEELQQAKWKSASVALQKEVDVYEAETKRMAEVGKIDPNALKPLIRDMVSEILGSPVNQIIAAHMQEDAQMIKDTAIKEQVVEQIAGDQTMPATGVAPTNGAGS